MKTKKTFLSQDRSVCLARVQEAYVEEGEIGQTVRHYYYKLLSSGHIKLTDSENSGKNAYNFVSQLLTEARKKNTIGWDAVVDPGRRTLGSYAYSHLDRYLATQKSGYMQVDVWRGQPRKLEIWVEKDGMAQFIHDSIRRYRVNVFVSKGFTSTTEMRKAAERFEKGKGWTLLYLGDFDPSGLDIDRNIRDELREYGSRPEIVRVGLTHEDTLTLPDEPAIDVKGRDSRAKRFTQSYGDKGFEIDALPARQLRERIIGAVESRMDIDALNDAIRVEWGIRQVVEARLEHTFDGLREDVLANGLPDSEAPHDAVRLYLFGQSA